MAIAAGVNRGVTRCRARDALAARIDGSQRVVHAKPRAGAHPRSATCVLIRRVKQWRRGKNKNSKIGSPRIVGVRGGSVVEPC